AVGMFKRAVEADPEFVEAHGQLAYARALLHYQYQPSPTLPAEVLDAVETAESLDATHPRARAARGWYRYYVEADYEGALAVFRGLLEVRPSDGPLHRSVGLLQRRLGRFSESIESFERARRLDPRSPIILRALTYTYIHARRYDDAEEVLALRSELLPEDEGFNARFLALARLLATGDPEEARRTTADLLAREPADACCDNATLPLYGSAWRVLPAQDRRAAMEARAQELEVDVARGDTVPLYHYLRAEIAVLDGRDAEARATWETALAEYEKFVAAGEEDYRDRMVRAWSLGRLGRGDEAIAEARAAASDPEAMNDHIQARPMTRALLAHMLARFGGQAGRDEAMNLLEPMATAEYGWISIPGLRADPYWDALRDHPRFRRLVSGQAPASAP
ncbi:MAG: tetratricopeptide repeat protein, partial [Gemmatimonadetes bacterium]|nr:tetratricopeptide repeat protein [Gemmatimonadota bacterium]NIR76927.1 tetratricopeptide repeat protein [Gemmatimonadota bacterium]NIT85458.1 tetratricopeptide repeat protein [Gemmatimonadota bacterium]NIU29271.1 tetratricopeptide repeat protein [Gemmatimonadota bacterium]NIU34352.1 tetratricopeptide repeat protein [Gemmatimonadota bacterium]